MGKWVKLVNNDGEAVALAIVSGFDRYLDHTFFEDNVIVQTGVTLGNTGNPSASVENIFSGSVAPSTNPAAASLWSSSGTVPLIPTVASVRDYYSAMSSVSYAVLRKPNTLQRMISIPDPAGYNSFIGPLVSNPERPVFNVLDAYKLNNMAIHVSYSFSVRYERPLIDDVTYADYSRIGATGSWSVLIKTSIMDPGGELALAANTNGVIDATTGRPLVKVLTFGTGITGTWNYTNNNGPVSSFIETLIPVGDRPNIVTSGASVILENVYNQLDTIFGPF